MSFETWGEGFGYEPGEVHTTKRAAEDDYNAGAAEKAAELAAVTKERDALKEALITSDARFRSAIRGIPIRDADEIIEHNRILLAASQKETAKKIDDYLCATHDVLEMRLTVLSKILTEHDLSLIASSGGEPICGTSFLATASRSASATEQATQIANELGAAEMLQGPYLDAVPIILRSLTVYSLALNVTRSSAKELAREIIEQCDGMYKSNRINKIEQLVSSHDLALTAAVRREDAHEADVIESVALQFGSRDKAFGANCVGVSIRALITPDQQSALDAYRDSVLSEACIRVANWLKAHRIDYASSLWEIESALKGSSDAAKEA